MTIPSGFSPLIGRVNTGTANKLSIKIIVIIIDFSSIRFRHHYSKLGIISQTQQSTVIL